MFWQEPQLPVDFLLRRVQDVMPGSVHEWIVEHQARLQVTFEGAHELLKISIDRQSAGSVPLAEGQLVYLWECGRRGCEKFQDL